MWKRIGTAGVAGALSIAVLGGSAIAATGATNPSPESTPSLAVAYDEGTQLSAEAVADANTETDALVAHLKGLGFTVTVETDEEGFRYPVFDEADEEKVYEAIDAYYEAQAAEAFAAMSADEKAELNAAVDAEIANLAEEGITAKKVEIAPGVFDIDWTDELDAALAELEGDVVGATLSEADVAEINAETDALVAHLKGLGFTVTVETDAEGINYPVFDGADEEKVYEAIEAFYQKAFADEAAAWSAEEKAEWNAAVDEELANITEAGGTASKVEIAPGVFDIDWSEDLVALFAEDAASELIGLGS